MRNIHTFVICAYKEQKNIEYCIQSLLNQTVKSPIIISTSTPNEFIKKIAKKYNVKLSINTKERSHITDINYAYGVADSKYVTLCHQDDVYDSRFAEYTIKYLEKSKNPIMSFTNYNELRNDRIVKNNMLLFVKRVINFPLLLFKKSKRIRLFTLSLGNAICAPTVTFNKEIVEKPIIDTDFKSNIDWISYIEFAKKDGEFVYIGKPLLNRRIHEESLTTSVISNNIKGEEDYKIFRLFWPKFIADVLIKLCSTSEKSNEIKK